MTKGSVFASLWEISASREKMTCLSYKHLWNTRWAFAWKLDIFTCDNNMLSSHVKYHRCNGYIINHTFHSKKLSKWNGLVIHWCHWDTLNTLRRPCNILYISNRKEYKTGTACFKNCTYTVSEKGKRSFEVVYLYQQWKRTDNSSKIFPIVCSLLCRSVLSSPSPSPSTFLTSFLPLYGNQQ